MMARDLTLALLRSGSDQMVIRAIGRLGLKSVGKTEAVVFTRYDVLETSLRVGEADGDFHGIYLEISCRGRPSGIISVSSSLRIEGPRPWIGRRPILVKARVYAAVVMSVVQCSYLGANRYR